MSESSLTLENIILAPPESGTIYDFAKIFGRDRLVEMEIGTGKGGFLLNRAKALPDRDFLGIEWANKIFRYTADRLARHGITNVRLMRTDAAHLMSHHMPPSRLTLLHIYHPDPWPKKRHHRRRLINPAFISAAVNALVPAGRLAVQTDHAEYFEQIQAVLRAEVRLKEVPFDVPEAGVVDGRISTNYEVKYLREGRPIYQIAMQRIG